MAKVSNSGRGSAGGERYRSGRIADGRRKGIDQTQVGIGITSLRLEARPIGLSKGSFGKETNRQDFAAKLGPYKRNWAHLLTNTTKKSRQTSSDRDIAVFFRLIDRN